MTFLLRPRTHAVSGELANTWSGRGEKKALASVSCSPALVFASATYVRKAVPSLKFSVTLVESHWMALTPNLVPKFLSKGEGAPPCSEKTVAE